MDIWASVSDFLRGTGMSVVYIGLEWDHSQEVMWLSSQDARYYLDDWFTGILLDFLNNSSSRKYEWKYIANKYVLVTCISIIGITFQIQSHQCLPMFH